MLTDRVFVRISIPILAALFFILPVSAQEYVLIGWNDLGMHCSNQNFAKIAVLPPYNNITAQLILKQANQAPQTVTSGYTIEYSIPNNTYSVGKTNFWTYAQQLFGLSSPLPPNIGLTGKGLTGVLDSAGAFFSAHGIPVTPYADSDLVNEVPFQLIHLVAKNKTSGNVLAFTDVVIPVSNEVGCVQSGCHSSEQAILNSHESVSGFNRNGPVLCASCHASNALGTTGIPEAGPFSFRIHEKHSGIAGAANDIATCYKCHPGPKTQCLRDIMGKNPSNPLVCQNCHGTMSNVAATIEAGRRPWLDEPKCGDCHGSTYAENSGKLYRQSTGHGGLFCSACHGSPHAILPTVQANDNLQNIRLQGYAGTLRKCSVCHTTPPSGSGPHGIVDTTTVVTAPMAPVLISPSNGAHGIITTPMLHWNPSLNAQTYRAQVSTDSLFTTIVLDDSSLTQTSIQLASLQKGQNYFWHIRTKNQVGSSNWSDVWKFETGTGSTFAYDFNRLWNLVSLPISVTNSAVSNIFPTASSGVFGYDPNTNYTEQSSLMNGKGYWVRFDYSQAVSLMGTPITIDTIDVIDGWNLIGSISSDVPVASITSVPPDIIASTFFGYNGSYTVADTIFPAEGYWVKTSAGGKLILSVVPIAKSSVQWSGKSSKQWNRIIISDSRGRAQTLYVASRLEIGVSPSYFTMPPVPPSGAFDVRFGSNQFLEVCENNNTSTFPIKISSAEYPITVSWDIHSTANSVSLSVGGQAIPINSSGSTIIENGNSTLSLTVTASVEIPQDYTLEQNYPNPFNPTTTFRYGLPTRSSVRISIYDILGQKIQEVFHGVQDAGYHNVDWSATVSSGLYLYRLEATGVTESDKSYTQMKKMVLLK
jgi:hypothetical protein